MTHEVPVTKDNYHLAITKIINTLTQNMSKTEEKIVSIIAKEKMIELNSENRKKLRELIDTDQFTFNNYIKKLKDKHILIKENNKLKLNPKISQNFGQSEITIKFKLIL